MGTEDTKKLKGTKKRITVTTTKQNKTLGSKLRF